jgi:DNA-binding response OmpR family regulator
MRVLVVEDDDRLAAALSDMLNRHRVTVRRARSAAEGMVQLTPDVDVVVLDLGLPDDDGFAVLTRMRAQARNVPILIATARGDLRSRLHGLNLGADDYIVKPYDSLELLARLHAVRRRASRSAGDPTAAPGAGDGPPLRLTLDGERRVVRLDQKVVPLTRTEFDILELLASTPGVAFRKEQILSWVWAGGRRGRSHTLEVHVASLRSKLGPDLIETVRGIGYRLCAD